MQECEIELKYKLPENTDFTEILRGILTSTAKGAISEPRILEYETTYYDTNNLFLHKSGLCYRVRAGDGYTATVKDEGTYQDGLHIRSEWNKQLPSDLPDIQIFNDLPIGSKLAEIVRKSPLLPIFKTHFKRTLINLTTHNASIVELAFDQGEILSGDTQEPLCEIELELKSGQLSDLLRLGTQLSEQLKLLPEKKSKYLRGLILSGLSSGSKDAQTP